MKQYRKLIFVDADDTSRAPMAKIILQDRSLQEKLEVESRGLVVLFAEPINQKAEAVLISNGYQPRAHKSIQLVEDDFGEDVLILTMEEEDKEKIWNNFSDAKNVYTLMEFVQERGEIPPLYGEPLIGYGQCYEMLEILISSLVANLNQEEET